MVIGKPCLHCGVIFTGIHKYCRPSCERSAETADGASFAVSHRVIISQEEVLERFPEPEKKSKASPVSSVPPEVVEEAPVGPMSSTERSRVWREKNRERDRSYMKQYMAAYRRKK